MVRLADNSDDTHQSWNTIAHNGVVAPRGAALSQGRPLGGKAARRLRKKEARRKRKAQQAENSLLKNQPKKQRIEQEEEADPSPRAQDLAERQLTARERALSKGERTLSEGERRRVDPESMMIRPINSPVQAIASQHTGSSTGSGIAEKKATPNRKRDKTENRIKSYLTLLWTGYGKQSASQRARRGGPNSRTASKLKAIEDHASQAWVEWEAIKDNLPTGQGQRVVKKARHYMRDFVQRVVRCRQTIETLPSQIDDLTAQGSSDTPRRRYCVLSIERSVALVLEYLDTHPIDTKSRTLFGVTRLAFDHLQASRATMNMAVTLGKVNANREEVRGKGKGKLSSMHQGTIGSDVEDEDEDEDGSDDREDDWP